MSIERNDRMRGAAEVAYEAIRSQIFDGTLSPGSRIKETDLAEQIGVSRTPVREAIRKLHSDGLVELSPNRGAHVPNWSAEDLRRNYALRALLEGYGASEAALHATEEEIAEMRMLADEMERLTQTDNPPLEEIQRLNQQFHGQILRASRDQRLAAMVATLSEVPLVRRTFHVYSPKELRRSVVHHIELVDAIERRDPVWANSIMRAHVQAARSTLQKTVPSTPPDDSDSDDSDSIGRNVGTSI